jgi:lactoylglutathione lyase
MPGRPHLKMNKAEKMITFIYYRDLAKGMEFYENVLGFSLAIDQGWCKIYQISDSGYLGIVDEKRGMQNWHAQKCVQICIRVPDVMPWYEYCHGLRLPNLSDLFASDELKIRAFVFDDPEGYQVEFQEATADDLLI